MTQLPFEIITDSTCDVPQPIVDQFGITVLPHYVIWGDKQYRDRVDISPSEFYARVQTDPVIPTTAQITVKDYVDAYEAARKKGFAEILVVSISNKLSGAYNAALTAAKIVDIPVQVIDSLNVTMGFGWQVIAAARMREAGGTIQQIIDKLDVVRKNLALVVSMNTVEYIRRGGRAGNAARLVAALLNIKPVVDVNPISGLVEPVGITRSNKNAVQMMYDKFVDKMDLSKNLHVAVMHGTALEEAEKLAEFIQKELKPVEILINETSPILGINTGPKALALAGYTD
jgi:DegV family protein with EDD domain